MKNEKEKERNILQQRSHWKSEKERELQSESFEIVYLLCKVVHVVS